MYAPLRIILCCVSLLLTSVCALAQAVLIQPGDKLNLTCVEEPALNREYLITRDGLILLPFVGAVNVGGMTATQASDAVAKQLVELKILKKATVSVLLGAEPDRPIRFAGAVKLSGEIPYRDDIRLSDVVSMAEPTLSANLNAVEITSAQGEKLVIDFQGRSEQRPDLDPRLRPGDLVFFNIMLAEMDVLVLGGVQKPGSIKFQPNMSARQAIEQVGGFSALGNQTRVRMERAGCEPQYLDLTGEGADAKLNPGDRLVVELHPVRRFVTVVGEVAHPGPVEYRDGMTLMEAISCAGDAKQNARREVKIVREGVKGKPKLYDRDKIIQGLIGNITLQPGDRIEVGRVKRGGNDLLKNVAGALMGIFMIGK